MPQRQRRPQSLVGVRRRHPDVDHGDVRAVLGHRGQQRRRRRAPRRRSTCPRSSSSRVSPSRSSAASSAITTRITCPLMLHRQHDGHRRRSADRAGHVDPPVHRGDPLDQPGEAAAPGRVRPADAVVADLEAENAAPFGIDVDLYLVGVAVLGRVGDQLGRAEVGDGLDRRGRPRSDVGGDRRRDGAAGGQAGQRAGQAAVEHRRVDAAGQVAQVGQRVHRVAVRGIDQLADRRVVRGHPASPGPCPGSWPARPAASGRRRAGPARPGAAPRPSPPRPASWSARAR